MDNTIHRLKSANMDVALSIPAANIAWQQDACPWNQAESTTRRYNCGQRSLKSQNPKTADLFENEQELKASLPKLRGLKAHMVFPGHGKPFSFYRPAVHNQRPLV